MRISFTINGFLRKEISFTLSVRKARTYTLTVCNNPAMEDAINRSCEAHKEEEDENSKPPNEGKEENRGVKVHGNGGQTQSTGDSSGRTVENASTDERGENRASEPISPPSVQLSGSDFRFDESSHLLSEVPVEYSLQPLHLVEEAKYQGSTRNSKGVQKSHSSQVQILNAIRVPDNPSRLELSPTSVTQSFSSVPSPTMPDKKLQPVENGSNECHAEQDKLNSPDPKPLAVVPILKSPSDGYNWRKYGQKQVKSPEGSRSYYRCTFSDCCAKKIECSDRSSRVIETVYRSHHNHDPPQKMNCGRENKPNLAVVPFNGRTDTILPERGHDITAPSPHARDPVPGTDLITETKQESNGSEETMEINVKEECVEGPEYKRRQKRSSSDELGTSPKHGKKPKFVVHAAGDVGISGDGYRWRKYGQKMVKGNPHPRNYYRCTSAGCPVRKHIERAVDNPNALVITYRGVHDHDAPVPRKHHATKNTHIPASSPPISTENLHINRTEEQSQTQRSADKEGELNGKALSSVGEKSSDSTRTLLSIGFEIKPC